MSTTHDCLEGICFNGSKAIDGIFKQPGSELMDNAIVTSTINESYPWIQIKLNQSYNILAVEAWKATIDGAPGIIVISLKLRLAKSIH